jgi:hypothetical protein
MRKLLHKIDDFYWNNIDKNPPYKVDFEYKKVFFYCPHQCSYLFYASFAVLTSMNYQMLLREQKESAR